jgi:ABC-type multidrug transport system permease subunit
VIAVARTMFREFWRTPEAVFWTYGFPLLMMIGLGLSLQPRLPPPVPVAAVEGEIDPALLALLRRCDRLDVQALSAESADRALIRGRVGALVRGTVAEPVLRADPARDEALLARLHIEAALREARDGPGIAVAQEAEDRPGSRYIDFLIPGLIGLGIMGSCMWGIGYNLVMMRMENQLRRLFVTPIRRGDFLLGYMVGRGLLVVPDALLTAGIGMLLFGMPFRGSVVAMVAAVLAGAFAFTGLGVLCSCRARSYESIAGLMNLCQLPMWVLGGALFSADRLTGVMSAAAETLPLTHLCRALRDVMLEPGGLVEIAWPLGGLVAFGLLTFALAMKLFRWD